jgi:hypothetical protein
VKHPAELLSLPLIDEHEKKERLKKVNSILEHAKELAAKRKLNGRN